MSENEYGMRVMDERIDGITSSKHLIFTIFFSLLCTISTQGKAFSLKGIHSGMAMSKAIAVLDERGYDCTMDHTWHGAPSKTCLKKGASSFAEYLDNINLITDDGKKLGSFTMSCNALNCGNMNKKQLAQALVEAKIMKQAELQRLDGGMNGWCDMDSSGTQMCVVDGGDGVTVVVLEGKGGPSFD